jgi:hypothetical protein
MSTSLIPDGTLYSKWQILFQTDTPPSAPGSDLVLRHFSVEDLALETAARFAALVKLLTDKGALHLDEQRSLLGDDFAARVDRDTLQTLAWLLLRAPDAEAGLQ